jgi:mevalonate kinase
MKDFPAKILLLGEYTILNGSKALACPYWDFSGHWSFSPILHDEARASHEILKKFINHCTDEYINRQRLIEDVERGLWFDSSIPHGFGLGSSGALIAAIYSAYGLQGDSIINNKQVLARMEDYFHGSSSGLDPLVSFVQKPILIHHFENVEVLSSPLNLKGFFIINSGKPRQTGPLVEIYQEKMKDPEFKQSCAEILSREVNFAIQSVLQNDHSNLFHHLWLISKFQWDYFPEMIPTQMRSIWSKGLESGEYILKLCGAGGGGYILGYNAKLSDASLKEKFTTHELREL